MLFKSLAKKIGYVFAACIILASILVIVTRLLTPVLDKHRPEFEKWATQLLQAPVTIQQLRVSWYQYQPVIRLDKVTVLNGKTQEPILQVQKIRIFFSIPQSLWQRKFVPSGIMISGTDVNIHETTAGQFVVQGFPVLQGLENQPYKSETPFADIMVWLTQQPHLGLQNINIHYTDSKGLLRFVTLYNLSIENTGDEHIILGKSILHQDVPTGIILAIQWRGKVPDLAQVKAKIYLSLSDVTLSQWNKWLTYQDWQVKEGVVNAKIWASWNHNTFEKIQTTFLLKNLNLLQTTRNATYRFNRLSGNLGWKRVGKGQIIAGDDLVIELPNHAWPVTSFNLSLSADANGALLPSTLNLSYADLADVRAYLFGSAKQWLTNLQLTGSLHNVALTFATPWTDWSHLVFNGSVSQLSCKPWHQFPGLDNISGSVKWNGMQGDIAFTTNHASFEYNSIFKTPIKIEQLSGDVHLSRDQQNLWTLQLNTLQLLNHDLAANVSGRVMIPVDLAPDFDINANFTMQNASHINHYLPLKIFNKNLIVWLNQAFLGGEVKSGHAQLRGRMSDFPFDQHEGIFSISGEISKIDFRYAPSWPLLRQVQGKLAFSNRAMTVDIDSAQMQNIPIAKVHGEIADLGGVKQEAILNVQSGDIATDFAKGLAFIHASPLEKTLGTMFSNVNITGPIVLKLGLTVPIFNPENTKVTGEVLFQNAIVDLVPWNLTLNNLNGQFQFTESTTTANNITGLLFQKPFTLSLSTIKNANNSGSLIRANVKNNLSVADLETWLKVPFSNVIKGETDVNTDIDFVAKAPIVIRLRSNLVGLSVDLPEQYAKKINEARDLTAEITVQEKAPLRARFGYGNLLSAALILDRKNEKFNLVGADISFGATPAAWPTTAGLYISGGFTKLDWNKIKTYTNQTGNTNTSFLKLRGIDIHIDDLLLGSYDINNLRLQVIPDQNSWDVHVDSPDISGQIQVPVKISRKEMIVAEFQKLHFMANTGTQSSFTIDVKSLPAISLVADDVSYNKMPLGSVTFKTSTRLGGLTIDSLRIVSPRLKLQARGEWTQANISMMTHLQGDATSGNVSGLLGSFGLAVNNFIASDGKITFNLNWADAPFAPSLASMNGRMSLSLGSGRIVDVGQDSSAKMGLGHMLSIFSLQSIPRRLSLDFSDVFQKGYSFDSIRGDFTLQNGDAYTSNMRIEGTAARVAINGRIGLKNKDYNLTLGVTPYVTSTLPVAATLLSGGNPIVGIAAFAVNGLIGSQVSKAVATYTYQVTGPWSNPNWKSVSGSNRGG